VGAGLLFPEADLTKITDIRSCCRREFETGCRPLFDLDSTVAWAKSQGGDTSRLGIIGFCPRRPDGLGYSGHNRR